MGKEETKASRSEPIEDSLMLSVIQKKRINLSSKGQNRKWKNFTKVEVWHHKMAHEVNAEKVAIYSWIWKLENKLKHHISGIILSNIKMTNILLYIFTKKKKSLWFSYTKVSWYA